MSLNFNLLKQSLVLFCNASVDILPESGVGALLIPSVYAGIKIYPGRIERLFTAKAASVSTAVTPDDIQPDVPEGEETAFVAEIVAETPVSEEKLWTVYFAPDGMSLNILLQRERAADKKR